MGIFGGSHGVQTIARDQMMVVKCKQKQNWQTSCSVAIGQLVKDEDFNKQQRKVGPDRRLQMFTVDSLSVDEEHVELEVNNNQVNTRVKSSIRKQISLFDIKMPPKVRYPIAKCDQDFASSRPKEILSSTTNNQLIRIVPVVSAFEMTEKQEQRNLGLHSLGLESELHQKQKSLPSHLFLELMLPLISVLLILLLLLVSCTSTTLATHQTRQAPAPVQASDLLTIAPPFAPTRRPQDPIRPAATSGSKFTRTNELDAFLDDMNHSELRTVASGRPISDLFHAKPMPVDTTPIEARPPITPEPADRPSSVSSPSNTSQEHQHKQQDRRSADKPTSLVGSHSEQQIYSECALILQRTYVKNIDDPK